MIDRMRQWFDRRCHLLRFTNQRVNRKLKPDRELGGMPMKLMCTALGLVALLTLTACASNQAPDVFRVTGVSTQLEFVQAIYQCQKESMVRMGGSNNKGSSFGDKPACELFYQCMRAQGIALHRDINGPGLVVQKQSNYDELCYERN